MILRLTLPLRLQRQTARWLAVLWAVSPLILVGCGGGIAALTGGAVPVGSTRAELAGSVVQATSPDQPVAGVVVTLVASDGTTYTTTTDAQGHYSFPSVPVGKCALQFGPPPGASLGPQSFQANVGPGDSDAIACALPPQQPGFNIASIMLRPDHLNLHVGEQAMVQAFFQGQGIPPGIQPSLVVTGGVGQISPHGQFLATHIGSGTITAIAGGQMTSIPVVVQL